MSEDGVYPSSVSSFLSGGCRVRSGIFQIQYCASMWPVIALGWFIVKSKWFQNWFTGIPNPTRSSRLGWGSQVFIGWVRMESIRRVFLPFFLGDVEFEAVRSSTIFCWSRWLVVALGWFVVWSSGPKLVYRNSESVPKIEFRMRLSGVYRMSEDEVYQPNIPSCLSGCLRCYPNGTKI